MSWLTIVLIVVVVLLVGVLAAVLLEVASLTRRWCWALLAVLIPAGAQAQAPLCPFGVSASGPAYYLVFLGDSLVSQHTRLDQATQAAARLASEHAPTPVGITHALYLTVTCPQGWTPPPPDSVTVSPDSLAFSYLVDTAGDTAWAVRAWQHGVMIDSLASRSYQLTALVWYGGLVMGCGGLCPAAVPGERMDFRQALLLRGR